MLKADLIEEMEFVDDKNLASGRTKEKKFDHFLQSLRDRLKTYISPEELNEVFKVQK